MSTLTQIPTSFHLRNMIKLPKQARIWTVLILFTGGMGLSAMAQSAPPEDWTVSAQTTAAQCESDGTITLSNQNADALHNFTYSLLKQGTTTAVKASSSNIFSSVAPGTYTVEVKADLKTDPNKKYTRRIENVVVAGDYKVLAVTYNPASSRAAYAACPKGTIVLNVENGRQENLTFQFVNAPSGVTTMTPISATKNADGTYTLARDTYPPGNYTLKVSDGCISHTINVPVKELSQLPAFSKENFQIFNSTFSSQYTNYPSAQYSCTSPIAQTTLSAETFSNKELMRYLQEGLFEIALTKAGVNPRDDQFQTISSQRNFAYALDMSPYTLSENYNQNFKVVIRLKDCPSVSRGFNVYFRRPRISIPTSVVEKGCGVYTNAYLFYKDYDGLFCFPITINLRESQTGPIVKTETFMSPQENLASRLELDLGKTYYYEIIDGINQKVLEGNFTKRGNILFGGTYSIDCGAKYVRTFKTNVFDACLPYKVQIFNKQTQAKVYETVINHKNYVDSPPLDFDVEYEYRAIKNGTVISSDDIINRIGITAQAKFPAECKRDVGDITFLLNGLANKPHTLVIRQGTKEFARSVFNGANAISKLSFASKYLPAGHYQLDVSVEGCPTVTHEYDWKGFYNRENFSYDSRITCEGLEVTPSGNITFQGNAVPTKTFFRILSGPDGGNTGSTIPLGKKFLLTQNGTYLLGILATNNNTCALDTIVINYERKPLNLATEYTSAYACVDGTKTGHILIKAQDGVPPYRYELWNADGTQPILSNGNKVVPFEILANDVAHFVHGVAKEVYTVKITDACSSSITQTVTIRDLTSLTIADADVKEICEGETIQLKGVALENYEWYLPNAKPTDMPFSTERNPTIPNAKVGHSGLYVLKFKPRFCGKGIEGSDQITVHPCYTPINPQLMTKVMK